MFNKQVMILLLLVLIFCSLAFAQTHTSPNYILTNPKILIAAGNASSGNFILDDVEIGKIFSGKAESANYKLNTSPPEEDLYINPPTLNEITSPTNNPIQALSGTKERGSSIYINGYEKIALDNEITWSCEETLSEGDNTFFIIARNGSGLESESVPVTITLDITPPFIVINQPLDGTIVNASLINVEGTVDGVSFTETREINPGLNTISKESTDEAGNTSTETVEIYLIRQPITTPPPIPGP